MADNLTHLPHVRNIQSAVNKWDPLSKNVFEVYFTLPDGIKSQFAQDEAVLTEQVTQVSGLDALHHDAATNKQRFMGADMSFKSAVYDDTRASLTITFNLNLRDSNDNFVYKVLLAWKNLNYNLADGTRTLMKDYKSDILQIAEANRDGTVWRKTTFNGIVLDSITGFDQLDYTDGEAQTIQVTFQADYWDMDIA